MAEPTSSTRTCRIVCLGTSLVEGDAAGPHIFERLRQMELPAQVELVDGGLKGLNLLAALERIERVVFVDSVQGFRQSPGIVMLPLPHPDIDDQAGCYGHQAGLGYLLAIAPAVLEKPLPECLLVGIEGPPGPEVCLEAAQRCIQLADNKFPWPNSASIAVS